MDQTGRERDITTQRKAFESLRLCISAVACALRGSTIYRLYLKGLSHPDLLVSFDLERLFEVGRYGTDWRNYDIICFFESEFHTSLLQRVLVAALCRAPFTRVMLDYPYCRSPEKR